MCAAHHGPERAGDWDITTGIGITALGVAAARAGETARADRLAADPYAEALVADAAASVALPTELSEPARRGWDPESVELWHAMVAHIGVRTRFFDDYLTHATREEAVGQVVLLAAGLDTRAYRLAWPPGTAVFEIDQPQVLAFKDRVLAGHGTRAGCGRRAVGVDLRGDWPAALTQAGFDPGEPTAWLAEGLLPYLPETAERELLDRVADLSAAGSRVAIHDSRDLTALQRDGRLRRLADCFGIDPTGWFYTEPTRPDPGAWFTEHGWDVDEDTAAVELAGRYRRRLPERYAGLFGGRSHYLTAGRPLAPASPSQP